MAQSPSEWFLIGEHATPEVQRRIAAAVSDLSLPVQIRSAPMLAHWYLLDALLMANQANRSGMHANAIALTRQCVEAISIVELGICGHAEAGAVLLKWESDNISPGNLRRWLEAHVWPRYGVGLWMEPWASFMREFASAVQPYAHYGRSLAQWQVRFHGFRESSSEPDGDSYGLIEMKPRAYDPQKATRITLFQAILTFTLGRMWLSANPSDAEFSTLVGRLGVALSESRYLDGHQTNWGQQFWAMVWNRGGGTILE